MWLARDRDNNLYLYNFKPHKVDEDWWGPNRFSKHNAYR